MPPSGEQVPPAVNSVLQTKDAALLADLEQGLPLMNQMVVNSVVRARNSPPPPPPDPDAKRFWRVRVDWSVDTDGDGSPDWAEFEIATRGTGSLVAGVSGDAFNGDTNGDGIQDGAQLDADLDGTPDADDPDVADSTATIPLGPVPRYAVFPIINAQPAEGYTSPLQISDKGTVLYTNGTWAGGAWTPLSSPDENYARAINDHDVILGAGRLIVSEDPEIKPAVICYWPAPDAEPAFMSKTSGSGTTYPVAGYDFSYNTLKPGPVLSNDGYFSMPTFGWEEEQFKELRTGFWRIPMDGQPATEEAGDPKILWNQGKNLRWGYDRNRSGPNNSFVGIVMGPDQWPDLPFKPVNVIAQGNNVHVAMGDSESPPAVRAYINGGWRTADAYSPAIDVSSGGIAIARNTDDMKAPVYVNGKWTGIDRTAPEIPAAWKDASVSLLDTTPGGWILAKRGATLENAEYSVMLPISIEGAGPHEDLPEVTGVDSTSIRADDDGGSVSGKIWIMAPSVAGSTSVRVTAPASPTSPLKLSGAGIAFDAELEKILQTSQTTFNIESPGTTMASGAEVNMALVNGTSTSVSKPVGVKVMKSRNVKVTLHEVAHEVLGEPANPPDLVPTVQTLQTYLNKIYGPQMNVSFTVAKGADLALNWDLNGNGSLDAVDLVDLGPEQQATLDARPGPLPASDIVVFLMGTRKKLGGSGWGLTNRGANCCWIYAETTDGRTLGHLSQTIAHEIGHVLVGYGHPDEEDGPSPLRGTNRRERMMHSGEHMGNPGTEYANVGGASARGHRFVKKEWDEAEIWLNRAIDGEGNQ
ncbi:MAG: hypothetical protein EOP88_11865 [Verrucomicrobiaceae bacterium]|nr:MAG: hypothetical protein EOP88_11865 [Verrucomicrobiaceae bacterium]